jgi:nucleoid-associated protein YgaU
MAVRINIGPSSPIKFMSIEETEIGSTGVIVTFLGFFEPPEFPDSDGDIDYTIEDRDRLDTLAQRVYGDELLWWVIAVRNNIDLPDAELNPGDQIVIPDPVVVRSRVK